MRRVALLVAFVLFCGALWAPELWVRGKGKAYAHQAVYAHDEFIVPGERIGPLRIGTTLSEARIILKQYGKVVQRGRWTCAEIADDLLCVTDRWQYADDKEATRTPGRVLLVATDHAKFTTRERFGSGDIREKWDRRYGPEQYYGYGTSEWWYQGLITFWGRFFLYEYAVAVAVGPRMPDRMPEYPVGN